MPYLSFDLDALARVPRAAAVAQVTPETIAYGLLQLWEHAWREKVTEVSGTMLRSCFRGAEPTMLAEALEAFKFTEKVGPDQFRVRGAERYLRITAGRSKGGKTASGNLKRGTETAGDRAGSQPGTIPGSSPAASRLQPGTTPGCVPALTASSEHSNSEQRTANTTAGAVGGFDDEVRRIFRALKGVDYDPPNSDAVATRTLLAKYGEAETLRRWPIALTKKFPGCSTLTRLLAEWNAYASADPPQTNGRPASGRAADADKDHSKPSKTIHTQYGEEHDFGT